MKRNRFHCARFWMLCAALLPATAVEGQIATERLGPTGIAWEMLVPYESVKLVVAGQHGKVYRADYRSDPFYDLVDDAGYGLLDGTYRYELTVSPYIDTALMDTLQELRDSGDEAKLEAFLAAYGIEEQLQSGSFSIEMGSLVQPLNESGFTGKNFPFPADQVILDDLIVDGSACIGFDCVNGESFGFDTLRLKENNLRLHFDDTSSSASFPSNDWRIVVNDSSNGGASYFAIEDSTAGRQPFRVTAGAPANSLFVASSGRVGFGTSTPVVDLHDVNGNTPTLRLEQNGSSGFTPQTWDVAGNEANFFIRDTTNGSTLPFRIFPAQSQDRLALKNNNVGIGTANPTSNLFVFGNNPAQKKLLTLTNNGPVTFELIDRAASDTWRILLRNGFKISRSASGGTEFEIQPDGTVIMGPGGVPMFTLDPSGNLSIAGDLNVTGTKNFAIPDPEKPGQWVYYAALEGPEAGTYCRGSARTVNGEAVILLPDHFATVTEVEGLTAPDSVDARSLPSIFGIDPDTSPLAAG